MDRVFQNVDDILDVGFETDLKTSEMDPFTAASECGGIDLMASSA